MRKQIIAGVIIVAVAAGGGWYVQTTRSATATAQNQPQYIFATVKKGEIRSTITGAGPVASMNGVLVKSNQTGTVVKLLAQDGDKVQAGQVVVVLDNDNLEAQYKQAQIDLQNAQANLDNLVNPQATAVRAQMLKLESARLTLKQRQQDVANLRVTAPRSGVISSVKVLAGSDLANNALLVTIFDDSAATFTMTVPQQAASAIEAGQKVEVTLSGFGTVEGTVAQSAGAGTPTTGNRDANVPVSVALPPLAGLRAGMVGQARLITEKLDYVVVANGSVTNDAVEVRTRVAGTLTRLHVAEGDRVETGAPLATLTSDTVLLQLSQAENDVKTQEQALDNLLHPANDPSGQLRQLRNKLEAAQITLASREGDFNDLQVKAPVAGQVSSLNLKVGDRVTSNANLFRVADYGQMQITIAVDELDVAKAKVGQNATITLDALPGRNFRGKVTKINPEGLVKNDIATFEVTIQVENPAGLMAGMNATVNVVVEQKSDVLWLPAQAVQVRGGKAQVQVLNGTKVEQKEIQVGVRTSQQVEVVSGLNDGDKVIQTIIPPKQTTGFGMFGGNRQQQTQTTFPQEQQNPQQQQRQQQRQMPGGGTGGAPAGGGGQR